MERRELLDWLAPLIPPPRSHQVRYHGVLAPCASGRDRVVPGAGGVGEESGSLPEDPTARSRLGGGAAGSTTAVRLQEATARAGIVDQGSVGGSAPPSEVVPGWARPSLVAPSTSGVRDPGSQSAENVDPPRRTVWADLLQRVFEVDALRCPECGGRMRILSAITEPDVARRILACLDLPSRAPPLGSYTRTGELDDGESATELTGGEWGESAGFDFDQSLPDDGRSAPTADPQRRMVPRDLPRFGRGHSLVHERSIPGAKSRVSRLVGHAKLEIAPVRVVIDPSWLTCQRWTYRTCGKRGVRYPTPPALRTTGFIRGKTRTSLVTGPSSSCAPWSTRSLSAAPPLRHAAPLPLPLFEEIHGDRAIAFAKNRTLGIRNEIVFEAVPPWLTRSRAYASPTPLPAPSEGSLPAWMGSPLAGRDSHPLDDELEFHGVIASPPIPIDQQSLVELNAVSSPLLDS